MAFDSAKGKQAGSISKRGKDIQLKAIRVLFSNILDNNSDKIQGWFDEVSIEDPAKALELYLKFSSFVIPKMRSIEIKEDVLPQEPIKITIVKAREEIEELKSLKRE